MALFETRTTHPVPNDLPPPPSAWREEFEQLATHPVLHATTLGVAHERLTEFWATTLRAVQHPPAG